MDDTTTSRLARNFDRVAEGLEAHATNTAYLVEKHTAKARLIGGIGGLAGVVLLIHHFL